MFPRLSHKELSPTRSGSVGTPCFQPREQLKAEKINTAVDMYALGCIFIELFGERKVWEGLTAYQIMFKVAVEGGKPDFSHLPESVKPICATNKKKPSPSLCCTQSFVASLNSVKTFYNCHFIWIVVKCYIISDVFSIN